MIKDQTPDFDNKLEDILPDIVGSAVRNNNITDEKPKGRILGFIKKHILAMSIAIVVIIALIVIFNLLPIISINDTKLVNVDTVVRIEIGQTISFKNGSVQVKVQNFSNTKCPASQTCYGSGPTVEYQLSVGGQKYATGTQTKAAGSKYQIETVSTDYKTYADIKIVNSDEN